MSTGDSGRRRWLPRRPLVLHPLLVAAWPVLFLLAVNVDEASLGDALPPLAVVVGVAAAATAVLAALLRDGRRAGLIVSVLAVTLLTYGHVQALAGDPPWLLPLWLAAAAAAVVAVLRARGPLLGATRAANRLGVVLVAMSLPAIVLGARADGGSEAVATPPAQTLAWQGEGPPRDVYFLVFDRYGSTDALRALFGIDNDAFIEQLRARGLQVLDDAVATHLRTAQSLSSTLRMDDLLDLRDRYGTNTGDQRPLQALLADHQVGRLFQSAGYRYVHIGSWWDPTASSAIADEVLGYQVVEGGRSDFADALRDTSLLAALPQDAAVSSVVPVHPYVRHRDAALLQLEQITEAARDPRPTFTLAHVLLPHEPYVFDAEGRALGPEDVAGRPEAEVFAGQLAYTNARILQLLDELLDVPSQDQPIIILQADEGPHPPRSTAPNTDFTWPTATDEELIGKLGILNAWYVPDGLDVPVRQARTPVNTFRVLFDALYGGQFGTLPERTYIFRDTSHLYDFIDVTERLGEIQRRMRSSTS